MTYDEKLLLTAYLCRHPEVIKLAINNGIRPSYFYGDLDTFLRHIVNESFKYFKKYGKIITPQILYIEVSKRLDDKSLLPELKNIIRRLGHCKIDNVEHAKSLLKKLVNAYKLFRLQQDLSYIDSDLDVNKILEKYQKIDFNESTTSSRIDLMKFSMEEIIRQESRIPTGIPWYDTLLNGGVMPGQVYGHLAISGGGKTTFAVQLLVKYASLHKYAIYFTYEQNLWGDLGQRIYACGSNVPKSRLLQYRDQLTLEERTRIKKFEQDVKPYILFHDMAQPNIGLNDVLDIKVIVEEYKANGYDIKMVLIDHLIPFLSKSRNYRLKDSYSFRQAIREVELQLRREVCEPFQCCALLFHQLKDELKSKKWTYIPAWSDAAEGKCFGEHLDLCTVFSPLDPDNKICYIVSSKVRDVGESKILLRLEPEYSRFIMETDEYLVEGGISIKKEDRYNLSKFSVI